MAAGDGGASEMDMASRASIGVALQHSVHCCHHDSKSERRQQSGSVENGSADCESREAKQIEEAKAKPRVLIDTALYTMKRIWTRCCISFTMSLRCHPRSMHQTIEVPVVALVVDTDMMVFRTVPHPF